MHIFMECWSAVGLIKMHTLGRSIPLQTSHSQQNFSRQLWHTYIVKITSSSISFSLDFYMCFHKFTGACCSNVIASSWFIKLMRNDYFCTVFGFHLTQLLVMLGCPLSRELLALRFHFLNISFQIKYSEFPHWVKHYFPLRRHRNEELNNFVQ